MPKYYEDEFEQDWETVILKKENTKSIPVEHEISFNRKITLARQKSNFSLHGFAQALGIKVNFLEKIENGLEFPEKKLITKMNRILSFKIPYK